MTEQNDIESILDELETRYEASVSRLRNALSAYAAKGAKPDPRKRDEGAFAYPELRIEYDPESPPPTPARAFARLNQPGIYTTSIARPALFREYLREQLEHIIRDYSVEVSVGSSASEIPYPYVLDGGDLDLQGISTAELSRWFPSTDLVHIGDEVADGEWEPALDPTRPLALFDALRTDFSLARLKHYTGTPPEHFQRFVLFTNYVRYVDEFVRFAVGALRDPESRFTGLSVPGGIYDHGDLADAEAQIAAGVWRRHPLPAYHLMTPDGDGITLVNIGVGPSNAKTICDHIAVLRPEAWLMIGHCGGLRPSQTIGDYVLAHAYLRDDHILDAVLPVAIPIPPIAEVQVALASAAEAVSGATGADLKKRMRTGTVVTTDDRNCELRYTDSALRFSQSRAIGIDMESATIAAQGYRFRVPYGTLLCVSDKPLHGELKLPGQANLFYEQAIAAHLQIGIRSCERLRAAGPRLHSRKLRAFNEPPFR
jgi:AMP nucleosidase